MPCQRQHWIIVLTLMVLGTTAVPCSAQPGASQASPWHRLPVATSGARTGNPPRLPFTDITASAGITFRHENGASGEKLLPETLGGGLAFLDHDRDGDQDLFFVNGTRWPHVPAAPVPTTPALYRNDGHGRFENITHHAGLAVSIYGTGVAVGDIDNDGDPDLFVAAVGANCLFRNDGGRFVDATAESGTAGDPGQWTSSAGFLDYDGDGWLDLFVCNYVTWSAAIDRRLDYRLDGIGRAYGPPMDFEGTFPYLYRNRGDGTFEEVAATAGLHARRSATGHAAAKALGVTFEDVDQDGRLDILVANDTVRNFVWTHHGDGTFEEVGKNLGMAYDRRGIATGAMGIGTGYLETQLHVAVTNYAHEMTCVYRAGPRGRTYHDDTISVGVGAASKAALSWGLFFFDADLDGRLDLFTANGHLEPRIGVVESGQAYLQSPHLFWNAGPSAVPPLVLLDSQATADLARPIAGRAAACADIDGDGDLDVAITQTGRSPVLLRNEQALGHHWLRVELNSCLTNRAGIGALIHLTADGRTQTRRVMPTDGFQSQRPATVTFGLGTIGQVDRLQVIWPDGVIQHVPVKSVDQHLRVDDDRCEFTRLMGAACGHLAAGDPSAATSLLRHAVARRPTSSPAWRNLARAHLARRDADAAIKALDTAGKLDPDHLATLYLTAIACLRLHRYDEAAHGLKHVLLRDPRRTAAWYQRGLALAATGADTEAVRHWRRARDLDPTHLGAATRLVHHARTTGDVSLADALHFDVTHLTQWAGPDATDAASLEDCIYMQGETPTAPLNRRRPSPSQ